MSIKYEDGYWWVVVPDCSVMEGFYSYEEAETARELMVSSMQCEDA